MTGRQAVLVLAVTAVISTILAVTAVISTILAVLYGATTLQ